MKPYLNNQYEASLGMLGDCIEQYDEGLWLDDAVFSNPAWQIAYHTIFYTNLYASPREETVVPWSNETKNTHVLGPTPWPPHEIVVPERTYSKGEMLAYQLHVLRQIPGYLDGMDPDARCWPFWYEESQLEFHMNNLRHIQHHTGQLIERHQAVGRLAVEWR